LHNKNLRKRTDFLLEFSVCKPERMLNHVGKLVCRGAFIERRWRIEMRRGVHIGRGIIN